jgi:hypothetical protein
MSDANVPRYVTDSEATRERSDEQAGSLVGALLGNLTVTERKRTEAGRWVYLEHDAGTGRVRALRGYELVRVARRCARSGLPVVMPRQPWRVVRVSSRKSVAQMMLPPMRMRP